MKKRTIKHITTYSWSYRLGSFWVDLTHRLFYRKIVVEGKENILKKEPIIYAPNHQNALMDPLAVIFTAHQQVVFLARGDIFHLPIVPAFFRWLKILPVYRIRDGKDMLDNNDDSFNAVIKVLESKRPISLFPEAKHNNKRQLLNFKKGIPRIAFQAEEDNDFKLGVKIIPVGIYYSKYNWFRSVLHIKYGKPISVADYQQEYLENSQKAMLHLRDDMRTATESLVIDIQKTNFYDSFETVRKMYRKKMAKRLKIKKLNQHNRFVSDKKSIQMLDNFAENNPKQMLEFQEKIKKFNHIKSKLKLSLKSIEKPKINGLKLLLQGFLFLIGFPIFLYGLINNLLVYLPPKILVKSIKDKQFHSSVKYLWGLFLIPLIYVGQAAIFWAITKNLLWTLIYFFSLGICGLAAQWYIEQYALFRNDTRLFFLKTRHKQSFNQVKNLHKEITNDLDNLPLPNENL